MTKKIAIMGSDNVNISEAIIEHLKNKNIEITCLSTGIDSKILKQAEKSGIQYKYLTNLEIKPYLSSMNFDLIALTEYKFSIEPEILKISSFINIHPSLLPAFDEVDAIKKAFLSGVKVSGVTVYRVAENKEQNTIIAQYPVLIGITTHIDEFESDIHDTEKKLYPAVIEAIVEDRVFDFQDLFRNSCHKGNCGSCHGCGS